MTSILISENVLYKKEGKTIPLRRFIRVIVGSLCPDGVLTERLTGIFWLSIILLFFYGDKYFCEYYLSYFCTFLIR